ncbi:MAG TPA: 3-oxoacyl-ACP synthase [Bacteroidales bacterium]|nr:3-oxoacyl-ACP synthase [Bacteroidales bacterium]
MLISTMENVISKYCIIKPHQIIVDGKTEIVDSEKNEFGAFMKSVYKHYEISYPKYFKMDNLCKVAFIASEIVLQANEHIKEIDPDKVGVILQNSHSSIDTDLKYNDTIKDKSNYFPSPAVFVYTLPNVMIGEICIRNKFQGENTCFIAKEFDVEFMSHHVNELLNSGKLDACIAGWADYIDGEYSAMLFLVEKNKENKKDNISFKPEFINQLIK